MKVGVAKETAPGERRVALVPEALGKLTAAGLEILVEKGAGAGALIPDEAYAEAGAKVVSTKDLYGQSDVILRVQKPSGSEIKAMRTGQAVIGFLSPLIDPKTAEELAKRGRDGDQPRRDPADAQPGAVDGRPQLPGERRRLQGRPHRRECVRALLPAPDHRRRNREARQCPHPRDRRRRAPGDRHSEAARRSRQGVRRPGGDEGAGPEPRRPVPRPQDRGRRLRRGRLRPPAHAGGAGSPAGRAERPHRDDGRRHHDCPGPRPPAAAPRDGRRGEGHEAGLGHRRHGGLGAGRQRRAEQGRPDDRDRQRCDDHRARQPAGDDAERLVRVLRPEHLGAAARDGEGRRAQPRLRGRGDEVHGHHPRRRRSSRRRRRSCSTPRRRGAAPAGGPA